MYEEEEDPGYNMLPGEMPRQNQVSDDLIRWQLSGDALLEEIEHKLKGEKWLVDNDKKTAYYKKVYRPLLNSDGINSIMSIITPILSQNIFLSDFEEEDIMRMTSNCTLDVIQKVGMKYREWNIDPADLNTIVELVEHQVYAALRRAYKGGTQRFLTTTQRVVEQRVHRQQAEPESKSYFTPLSLLRKR